MLQNLSNFFSDWKMQLGNLCLDMETKQPIYFSLYCKKKHFSEDVKSHPENLHTNNSSDNSEKYMWQNKDQFFSRISDKGAHLCAFIDCL